MLADRGRAPRRAAILAAVQGPSASKRAGDSRRPRAARAVAERRRPKAITDLDQTLVYAHLTEVSEEMTQKATARLAAALHGNGGIMPHAVIIPQMPHAAEFYYILHGRAELRVARSWLVIIKTTRACKEK